MELQGLLETTVSGLGYELVSVELSNRGRMLRVFIDRAATGSRDAGAGGITVEDCARVSNQLARVLEVGDFDYDRLEVSSPGLDRPLKKEADFARFAGEQARLTLRVPLAGRRRRALRRLLGTAPTGLRGLNVPRERGPGPQSGPRPSARSCRRADRHRAQTPPARPRSSCAALRFPAVRPPRPAPSGWP